MADKVLMHAAYPLSRKHLLITVARAKQLQEQGDEVLLTYCAAKNGVCTVNHVGNPASCLACQTGVKRTAASAGISVVPLKDFRDPPIATSTPTQLKKLVEGVNSDLISRFRLLPLDIRKSVLLSWIKRRYFKTANNRLTAFQKVIATETPDRIEVFNGRLACAKFALLAAERAGLPITTLEMVGRRKPIVFAGHAAHDRVGIQDRILRNPADMEVAEAFYSGRRSPRHNRFAKKLGGEFKPPDIENFQKRITFFLSSQDEFESLGREWKSEFDDYAGVILAACKRYPNYLFTIRFHPNQADIGSDIISPFNEVRQQPNVRTYLPEDPVNSYQLIEWSDIVVTFGSTVTAEACWASKPVVLLGPSFYDRLEMADRPATIGEFLAMLADDLQPKDRTNAARLANYFQTDHDDLPHLDCEEGRFQAKGFRLALQPLRVIARWAEVVSCRVVKTIVRRNAKRRQAATTNSPQSRRAASQRDELDERYAA